MSDQIYDFSGLSRRLLSRAREFLPVWLPGGRMQGREYVCGSLRGGPGSSTSVNVDTGKWSDFADADVRGGDLISLYAAIHGVKQGEAAKTLADLINFRLRPEGSDTRPQKKKDRPQAIPADIPSAPITETPVKDRAVIAPPPDAPQPSMTHPVHGAPIAHWTYRSADGGVLFYIARYDEADGSKQFVPWSWSKLSEKWIPKGWEEPRPLFGLDLLALRPSAPVIIVEGEKAAEAARRIAGKTYVVVTWPNGSNAPAKASWSVLGGRKILLWPDADRHVADTQAKADRYGVNLGDVIPYDKQPGPRAMNTVAACLHHICSEIKLINVGIDLNRKDGWDAADAETEGWTFSTLIDWARPRVSLWEPAKEESPTLNLTVQALQQNITVDAPKSADTLEESPSLYAEWERLGIVLSSQGSPIANVDNALRVIERHEPFNGIIWYDEFHHKYLTKNTDGSIREWQDVDDLNMMGFMQRVLGLRRISDDMVRKAAIMYAHKHVQNEPRDWMSSLVWDGTSRLDTFFIHAFGAEDSEYIRAAARNFWLGMVARIFSPGCQVDNMVVLEGAQGAGKTRALRIIGGKWYTEANESVTDKDFFMALHGKMIIEIAELDSFNRAEVTRIKQVVTCTTDRYRAPYGRTSQDNPRMSVFVGTTNETAYLRDNTGGRRFWPISCSSIDHAYIQESRDQLFAEAVHLFNIWKKSGDEKDGWWLMPAEATLSVQEQRRQDDEWETIITDYLKDRVEIRLHDLASDCLKIDASKLDRFVQHRIASIMRSLGWDKHNLMRGGIQMKVWRNKLDTEDILLRSMVPQDAEDGNF